MTSALGGVVTTTHTTTHTVRSSFRAPIVTHLCAQVDDEQCAVAKELREAVERAHHESLYCGEHTSTRPHVRVSVGAGLDCQPPHRSFYGAKGGVHTQASSWSRILLEKNARPSVTPIILRFGPIVTWSERGHAGSSAGLLEVSWWKRGNEGSCKVLSRIVNKPREIDIYTGFEYTILKARTLVNSYKSSMTSQIRFVVLVQDELQ